jgi:hypothetical protein
MTESKWGRTTNTPDFSTVRPDKILCSFTRQLVAGRHPTALGIKMGTYHQYSGFQQRATGQDPLFLHSPTCRRAASNCSCGTLSAARMLSFGGGMLGVVLGRFGGNAWLSRSIPHQLSAALLLPAQNVSIDRIGNPSPPE